ncbi:MAG TPA: hypothetical protein VK734_11055 [Bradyrhizobium sp.]|nr:hypothetical protein [Bradyrhizobium sp.]
MTEQQPEVTESGSVSTGSTVSLATSPATDAPSLAAAVADLAASVLEAPAIAPDHEALPKDETKVTTSQLEVPKQETPRGTGKVLIMAPSDRTWHDHSADVKVDAEARSNDRPDSDYKTEQKAKRGFPAMAAMVALATIAGAVGGALATTGFTHVADAAATTPANSGLEASIARIDSDVMALKAGLEHTSKASVSQFNKTSDRLDKIERAQSEPNAKLVKLTEAVDKLRATPPAPAAPVQAAVTPAAAKEVTGSVTTPAGAAPLPVQVAAAPAVPAKSEVKPEVGRLPTVDGWALTDVGYGGAMIENRRGTYEVYAGDFVPGLGRIDAIRKQDGHWVVVTQKGLILPR